MQLAGAYVTHHVITFLYTAAIWLVGAGPAEFKQYMRQNSSKPYWKRLADFHFLMYLAKQPGLDLINDIAVLLECIKHKASVPEGYTLIIDSLAES